MIPNELAPRVTSRRLRSSLTAAAMVAIAWIGIASSDAALQPPPAEAKADRVTEPIAKPRDASADAGGAKRAPWPTYHGDFTLDGIATSAVPDAPKRLWRFDADREVTFTPVASSDAIFFTNERGRLFSVDLAGKERWNIRRKDDEFSSPPVVIGDLVVVGSLYGKLLAYDAASGEERWSYDIESNIQGSATRVELEDGRVGIVVNSQSDGALHCVDAASGKPVWTTEPIDRCDGSASVSDGRIAMGSCASALHVFSIAEAKKSDDVPLGDDAQVAGGVAFAGTIAFVGTRVGSLCAVDVAAGEILWRNETSRAETFTTPAIGESIVVFASEDGIVHGLDRVTGETRWTFDTEDSPFSPAIARDRVVISSGGRLFLLELATGKKIWTYEVSDWITGPAVVAGRILVGADDGTVTAFGAE